MSRGFVQVSNFTDSIEVLPPPGLEDLAKVMGTYDLLWRPENLGAKFACDLEVLLATKARMLRDEHRTVPIVVGYKSHGRRTILRMIRFVEDYRDACERQPTYKISVKQARSSYGDTNHLLAN